MHEQFVHTALILALVLIYVFGLVSKLTERLPVTAPMVFVALGILAGPVGLDLIRLDIQADSVILLAEITLALILFVDASEIGWRQLVREKHIPLRLLSIALPLVMVTGFAIAFMLFTELNPWVIALLALILSPTDAALGQAVIRNESVPEKIRRSISAESGLNDGIALPLVLVCVAALSGQHTGEGFNYWVNFTGYQLVLGPIIGGAVGWLGGMAVDKASQRGWMASAFQRLSALSLAVLAYVLATTFGGNGFIATFFAGLLLGIRTPAVRERIHEFGEAEGQLFELFVFLIFGLVMIPIAVPLWDAQAWMFAFLSLTVIRMLPVFLSLKGLQLGTATSLFIGWFGPRGIASVLFLLIVIGELGLAGYERLVSVVILTVLLSVFLHGISAVPFASWYGRLINSDGQAQD